MLGGIIAGALGGAGQAVGQIADDQIKQNQRVDLLRVQQEIEQEKLRFVDELSKNRALWEVDTSPGGYAERKTAADTAREKSLQGVRTDAAVDQATKLIPVEVQKEEKLAPVRQANAVSQAKAVKGAELEVINADTLAKGKNPEILKALRSIAAATESSATRASAALTQLGIEEKRAAGNLLKEYEDPKTTPERKTAITQSLIARGVIKPGSGEFDTEKITTETTDSVTGAVTKTERTQRRRPDSTGAAPKDGAPAPTQADIDYLKANPGVSARFDGQFGPGAAQRILGSKAEAPVSEVANLSDRELRQIAGVQGHTRQQQAKTELAARAQRKLDERKEAERRWNDAAASTTPN
jgi:hypothetical protein